MTSIINELFGKSEKQRSAPVGDKGLEIINKIVSSGKAAKVNGVELDLPTSKVYIEIYSQLSADNKAKLLNMNLLTGIDTVWKLKNN